ncbi:hypothetical protein Hypma_012607 [Hypsizygus marmoreus]|uniref:Uncharacterized protein n=1 Tax=Hypsizygus marmoreus TaxID=39966 RepID=A0A369JLG2_HYPMA|nr:hypothetical protein Hypma_012607 [Hypsizygus marmoreus]
MPTQPTMTAKQFTSEARKECVEVKPSTKVPIVSLEWDKIMDALAASLATSLLGHVLFLKSQVPLPVQQLSRIQSFKSTARAAKQRTDLLTSFDTLTSHLNTTFTALSTALARSSTSDQEHPNVRSPKDRPRAYLAILVGPSMGSAKSKVMFAVDGLETKYGG